MPELRVESASAESAERIAQIRTAAAQALTERYGKGHWSLAASATGVVRDIATSKVYVAIEGGRAVATFRLSTRKPWAIDLKHFKPVRLPIYLTTMAVAPDAQRRGIGRRCVEEAIVIARLWPADAIRLDAYDAPAGAGPFYEKCGFSEAGRGRYRGTPHIFFELLLT
jgi:GNAT superfamily N-acetyltransferase